MNEFEEMFNEYIDEYGKDVQIIHRVPKIVDGQIQKNLAGETICEEPTTIDIKCDLIEKNEYEKTSNVGKLKIQGSYVIGMFKLEDMDYLKEDNQVIYEDPKSGLVSKYDIKKVLTGIQGHYEVVLV